MKIHFNATRIRLYSRDTLILKGEIELKPNTINLVIGDNAAGKTILLTTIAGLFTDGDKGKQFGIIKSIDYSSIQIDPEGIEMNVGWVRQNPSDNFVSSCSADEIILPFLHPSYSRSEIAERLEFVLQKADIFSPSILEQEISTLSSGQAQKLAVCVAIAPNPHILLLDEAYARLDHSQQELLSKLISISLSKQLVLVVTHQPELLSSFFSGKPVTIINVTKNENTIELNQQNLPSFKVNMDGQEDEFKTFKDLLEPYTQIDLLDESLMNFLPRNNPKIIPGKGKLLFTVNGLQIKANKKSIVNLHQTQVLCGFNIIVGENGSGKTSFGEFITGLMPTNTFFNFFRKKKAFANIRYNEEYHSPLRHLRKEGLTAFLPAESSKWITENTVRDEILLLRKELDDDILSIFQKANIDLNKKTEALSAGQKKLISILSLPDNLEIIFLDEPFTDLSKSLSNVVFKFLLNQLKQKKWKALYISTASLSYFKNI